MQIKRGTTRVVLIAFGFVFKFPTLKQATVHGKLFRYFRGLVANVTEFATYLSCDRASFLVPVFSLGFVNIQRYQDGEKPTWDDVEAIFRRLPKEAQATVRMMDMHFFAPSNFRRNTQGLRMIDFGDGFAKSVPLSSFLVRFHKEFGEATKGETTATTE